MKYVFLIIPCILCLWVPLYNRLEPTLWSIPFFYWFLLVLVPVSALFIWIAARIEGSDS
ncbi:DUF3311 domain-containing protein [Labrys wisconsinensis]|uniref:DUF3311 domain-containing protein n=1 Tax=Labrys wisconsinensis TaxID=425677 RepID=A0ABU0JLN2_9HYPH|nr:DUF3311 domain-containing protein [Labrys wisconsinensis]MDQ0474032.1 hypothetical protein [Labrys wisconsinensis]